MKKITHHLWAVFAAATAAVVALTMLSAPANAKPSMPQRSAAIAKDLKCSKAKGIRVYEASEKNTAITCRVARKGGVQRFLVVRYEHIRPAVRYWKANTVASSDYWGGREAGCFVKKGRYIINPNGAEGADALRWCRYAERRVGGRIIVGN